ncbi:MAG: hypothetical protein FWH21_06555, partial [Kiritimatiellaeota bacterium]|nr:hypothetical protein [Kiritimatiellota bacterium]
MPCPGKGFAVLPPLLVAALMAALTLNAPPPPDRPPTVNDAARAGVRTQAEFDAWAGALDPVGAWFLAVLFPGFASEEQLAAIRGPA